MEENENENKNKNKNENENENPIWMKLLSSHADPLISSIVTSYVLILLYFPQKIFFKIIFTPVLVITFTLLLALLRSGAAQKNENKESSCTAEAADHDQATSSSYNSDQDHKWVACEDSNSAPNGRYRFEDSFVEWNVRAPLEVIYEGAEDLEGETGENVRDPFLIERYASLSLYYPETDSDSSSDGGGFLAVGNWEDHEDEDEEREGLIEIALDNNNKRERSDFENFQGEEENNLIEIDISPVRGEENLRFSGD